VTGLTGIFHDGECGMELSKLSSIFSISELSYVSPAQGIIDAIPRR